MDADFEAFLKSARVSVSQKKLTHKGKRVGTIETIDEGGVWLMVFAQFDGFFDELIDKEPDSIKRAVLPKIAPNNCPRCIPGKCSVTGVRLTLENDGEAALAKKLIALRCEAVDHERVPKCNYIKLSEREQRNPCRKCKPCNPKCRALKNF